MQPFSVLFKKRNTKGWAQDVTGNRALANNPVRGNRFHSNSQTSIAFLTQNGVRGQNPVVKGEASTAKKTAFDLSWDREQWGGGVGWCI